MVQQLRTLAALPEDPGSISSTYVASQSSVTPVPAEPMPSSSLSGHGQAHGTQTCTVHRHIYTHKLFSFSSVLCELENTDSQPYMEGPEGFIAPYLLITCIAF